MSFERHCNGSATMGSFVMIKSSSVKQLKKEARILVSLTGAGFGVTQTLGSGEKVVVILLVDAMIRQTLNG
jgi:hypothetical protein